VDDHALRHEREVQGLGAAELQLAQPVGVPDEVGAAHAHAADAQPYARLLRPDQRGDPVATGLDGARVPPHLYGLSGAARGRSALEQFDADPVAVVELAAVYQPVRRGTEDARLRHTRGYERRAVRERDRRLGRGRREVDRRGRRPGRGRRRRAGGGAGRRVRRGRRRGRWAGRLVQRAQHDRQGGAARRDREAGQPGDRHPAPDEPAAGSVLRGREEPDPGRGRVRAVRHELAEFVSYMAHLVKPPASDWPRAAHRGAGAGRGRRGRVRSPARSRAAGRCRRRPGPRSSAGPGPPAACSAGW